MQFTYSTTADALSVDLADGVADRTVEVAKGVLLDLDAKGRPLSLEILNASGHYPRDELEALGPPVDYLTLLEAQRESGLDASTLRRQAVNGRLVAEKRGRDWVVARHELVNYLESRAPQGRPAAKRKARRPKKRTAKKGS